MSDSPFFLVPLPQKSPEIPLGILGEKTIVGRKTLSDLHIRSSESKKKLSVSRRQAEIKISGKHVILEVCGLNPIVVTRPTGKEYRLDRGNKMYLSPGDTFTLCGTHFPFLVGSKEEEPETLPNGTKGHEEGEVKVKTETNGDTHPSVPGDAVDQKSSEEPKDLMEDPTPSEPTPGSVLSPPGHRPNDHRRSHIGKRVKVFQELLNGSDATEGEKKWMRGTIKNYRDLKYEIGFDEGSNTWEAEDELVFINSDEEREGIQRRREKAEKKRKQERRMGGYYDKSQARQRRNRQVNYVEWESSSSSEGQDVLQYRPDTQRRRNVTVITAEQLAEKKTLILYHDTCLKHFVPKWHLEKPERLLCVMEGVHELKGSFPQSMDILSDFPPVPRDILLRVHDNHYIERMEASIPNSDLPEHVTQFTQEADDRTSQDFDTFMSQSSMDAALLAAGSVCVAIDKVHSGEYRNAFCVVRPPGHHCGRAGHTATAASQGYCIINNVAVAAEYAWFKYGPAIVLLADVIGYKKIAVIDFDVHHGNGTEELLAGKEHFLFVSIHVGAIYPRTGRDNRPRDPNIVNASIESGAPTTVFHQAFDERIIPTLDAFQPDFVFISAGFDAHRKDPTEDGLLLEDKDYFIMTEKLKKVAEKHCGGKLVSVLEGGYHLPSLRRSSKEHLSSLLIK